MSTRVFVEIELAEGVQPTLFTNALYANLQTSPAIKSCTVECPEDDSDWTQEELAHLVTLGPERTQVKVEETRHLYLRISPHLRVSVRKQELVLYEFLCVSPVVSGQKELHKRISGFHSAVFDEVVFNGSNAKTLTALYSKLRKKLEGTTSELIARRGVYGFKTAWKPVQGRKALARKADPLLDPRVTLDDAIGQLGGEETE